MVGKATEEPPPAYGAGEADEEPPPPYGSAEEEEPPPYSAPTTAPPAYAGHTYQSPHMAAAAAAGAAAHGGRWPAAVQAHYPPYQYATAASYQHHYQAGSAAGYGAAAAAGLRGGADGAEAAVPVTWAPDYSGGAAHLLRQHHRKTYIPNNVCYDFLKGRCERGAECRYSHDLARPGLSGSSQGQGQGQGPGGEGAPPPAAAPVGAWKPPPVLGVDDAWQCRGGEAMGHHGGGCTNVNYGYRRSCNRCGAPRHTR